MTGTTPHTRQPNHLLREKSPYLLQHLYNPVDWYPWGEEAFEKARGESKPIFLSVGYSTCHWCHVMERESFEDALVAELLNRDFVPIKVDREERPEVDRIYMHAAQGMGMGGGWPLNMFLTPTLEPFYGGTYFPPEARHGRPGLKQVLAGVIEAWRTRREDVERSGRAVIEALEAAGRPDGEAAARGRLMEDAWDYLSRTHDPERGGFGTQPKFPSTVNLSFLLRFHARDPERNVAALEMVTRQLDAMNAGGIHDHLGGGFHRYATDRDWLVPHFEKMLYDQALLAWIYLEAFQVTRREAYAKTARSILDYVARDLSAPEGGFYSAEDADSEGDEGKFYVWTPAEIAAVLGPEDAARVAFRYGVTERGNFEHGASIFSEVHTLEETAAHAGLTARDALRRLDDARARLFAARERRPRPHRDDKVLAAWNGLMISAFARGARVLEDRALAGRALRAGEFLWTRLRDSDGALRRRWREGEAAGEGQLDDHAYATLALVDLYAATHDPLWLERAVELTERMVAQFWDDADGGFWESPPGDPSVRVRMKDAFDGAEMAGNSIAALVLVLLGRLLDRRDWLEKAERTFDYYARRLAGGAAAGMPQMLVAMDAAETVTRHVVIAGRTDHPDTRAMIAEFDRRFLPHDLLIVAEPSDAVRARLRSLVPFAADLPMVQDRVTAYVCVDYACRLPATDPESFAARLDDRATSRS